MNNPLIGTGVQFTAKLNILPPCCQTGWDLRYLPDTTFFEITYPND